MDTLIDQDAMPQLQVDVAQLSPACTIGTIILAESSVLGLYVLQVTESESICIIR